MRILKVFEQKFLVLLLLAVVLGLTIPAFGKSLSFLVIPVLMIVFFFTYLKIDFLEVITHIKHPLFIGYILGIFLIVAPTVVYGMFSFLKPDMAVAMLLLCSMPPAIAAPALTDMVKGNTSLTLAVSFLSYLIAPCTVVLLFLVFTQKAIHLDIVGLSKTLFLINFVPLIIAQIVRRTKRNLITKTQSYYSIINISLIAFVAYTVIAAQAEQILKHPTTTLFVVCILYLVFIGLHIIGYYVAFWRKKEDKIALSVSKAYMNNALAIGLAVAFFNPRIAFLMVLSEIPWNTTLGLFRYGITHKGK